MTRLGEPTGPIAWMARNRVAANLLMIGIIVGGLVVGSGIKREIFPELELDMVAVSVPYPGASPEEVEQGILLAIEEAVRSLDGVKRVTSIAREGLGMVNVELLLGVDSGKALQDVKSEIDRITSFPEEAEEPQVSLLVSRERVVTFAIHGDLDDRTLRDLGERARDEILQDPRVTTVELGGVRPLEIGIEVPQAELRAHGLSLETIAERVRRGSVELPGGGVRTRGGEVLLRTQDRRDLGSEFAEIALVSRPDGTLVRVGDVATIRDGFEDIEQYARFDERPAVLVTVLRVGDQASTDVSDATHQFLAEFQKKLPPTVGVDLLYDASEILRDRISLLLRNAALGLVLVVLVLGLFLKVRLAGWVTMGIPVSFFGAFLLMPLLGVSINMISLAAFILTLGIVVDDAIVIGESIYERRERGLSPYRAGLDGTRIVAVPVVFAVLTTMAAFSPLLMIPGVLGKIFVQMPLVILPVLFFSLVESLFILPAHLNHATPTVETGLFGRVARIQEAFSARLRRFIDERYAPVLEAVLEHHYLAAAAGIAILILTVGYVAGGRIAFSFMPRIDTDVVVAGASYPYGTPVEDTEQLRKRILSALDDVLEEHGRERITRGVYSHVGYPLGGLSFGPGGGGLGLSGAHQTEIQVFLVPSDERAITASELAKKWQEAIGEPPGLETLDFEYSTGPSSEPAVNIELSHPDIPTLERAARSLAASLRSFAGVISIDDGVELGKPQLDFRIRPEGRSLGITATDLGRQIRNSFYGAEALRQQRGRNEVRVMVRLPEDERRSLHDVEALAVRAPDGGEIPILEAAEVTEGRAYTEIRRTDGRRAVNITADAVPGVANANQVLADLEAGPLAELLQRYPRLRYSYEGLSREQQESLASLRTGFVLAMIAIFGMLAIPFKSYVQPIIVMTAIPFGVVGAVVGHVVMGLELSTISMFGIVALAGVVVNDSLVLIDAANQTRRGGLDPLRAIKGACLRRFRPILLTSVTTFFGLAPMIFETSIQARFLVPMAVSLGYGILFATVINLLLVPALYLIIEDARHRLGFVSHEVPGEGSSAAA